MKNIMIDIETLGTAPGSVILSIGAVQFEDDGTTGETLDVNIDLQSCLNAKMRVSADTLMWWLDQEKEAAKRTFGGKMPLRDALEMLSEFIKQTPNARIWANSPNFDIVLLETAYRIFRMDIPWKFWNLMDVRTLISLNYEVFKSVKFEGVAHHALSDCLHQVRVVTKILNQ